MQTAEKKGRSGTRTLFRRLTALALCIVMCVSMFPAALAAGDGSERTYVLRVDTGVNPGTQVLYLGVRYKDDKGSERTEFIFPHERSLSNSYVGYSGDIQKRTSTLSSVIGYTFTESPSQVDGLRANNTDFYVLNTKYKVETFLALDVFIRYPGGADERTSKSWTCNGFFFYEATKIDRLDMMGYCSDDYYLNFEGTLLARMKNGPRDFNLMQSDARFRLTGEDIENIAPNSELSRYVCSGNKLYYINLDIADIYEAGIEALATEVKDKEQLIGVAEALTYCLEYEDIYGMKRHTEIPVITSALMWALENYWLTSRMHIAGIAQQGESVVIPVRLPDMVKMTGFTMLYGQAAAAEAGLVTGHSGESDAAAARRKERVAALANDSLRITGLALYEQYGGWIIRGGTVGAALEVDIPEPMHPLMYYTAPTAAGVEFASGETTLLDAGMSTSMLKPYENGKSQLKPLASGANYLVEIQTDDMDAAATTSDIQVQITYQAVGGSVKTAEGISLEKEAKNINGYWPAKTSTGSGITDASYLAGVSAGGKLYFTLDLDDVYAFQSVTFRMSSTSTDDWQMAQFTIYRCSAVGKRTVDWKDLSYSDRMYSRAFSGLSQKAVAKYPTDDERKSGNYVKVFLNGNDNTKTIFFNAENPGGPSIEEEDEPQVVWEDVRYSMSYRETQMDLGFVRQARTYTVNVNVASNESATRNDGDCGSDNLFYFKLLFEKGNSGYVLANQQLTADGFRAGMTETFTVLMNEDYGELLSVAIIPELDSDDQNQSLFDKLKIDSIEIVQQTNGGTARTWRIDDVGWIGIEYVEKGAMLSTKGFPGYREGEIARSKSVNAIGYSLNLLFAMDTGSYDRSATDVNYTPGSKNPAYKGTIVADIEYLDSSGVRRTVSVDVAAAIAEFADRKPEYYETSAVDQNTTVNKKAKVDPNYMLREDHTDRFIVSLQDVRRIEAVRFGLSSEVATRWKLTNMSIAQIISDGALQIDWNNNYIRTNEIEMLTYSNSITGYELQVFAPSHEDETLGPQQTLTVTFGDHEIKIDEGSGEWKPVINRTPETFNDTMNIFIRMKKEKNASPLSAYPMLVALSYETADQKGMQTSLRDLDKDEDRGIFYARGVQMNGFRKLNELKIDANSTKSVSAQIDTMLIQHLRSGVVIENYFVQFGYNDIGVSTAVANFAPTSGEHKITRMGATEQQVVKLFFSDTMEKQALLAEINDLLVAIRYTNEYDPTETEIASSYCYLTDFKDSETGLPIYSEINPGDIVEIPFSEGSASKITGITLVKAGDLNAEVESAAVAVMSADGKNLLEWYDFADVDVISTTPRTSKVGETNVVPLRMKFITTQSAEILDNTIDNGKEAPIRMTVSYKSQNGLETNQLVIDDIHDYLVDGSFVRGEKDEVTATIELFIEDVSMIRSVTLQPYSTGISSNDRAVWGIRSVYYEAQINKETRSHLTEGDHVIYFKSPETVNLCTVDMELIADSFNMEKGIMEERKSTTTETGGMVVAPGRVVIITPEIIGQLEGYSFTAEVERKISGTETYEKVTENWRIDDSSAFDEFGEEYLTPAVYFTAPENETGVALSEYRVTIGSEEVPAVKAYFIIQVKSPEATDNTTTGGGTGGTTTGGGTGGTTTGGENGGTTTGGESGGTTTGGTTPDNTATT